MLLYILRRKKIKYQNECKIQKKNQEVQFEFKIYSKEFLNTIFLEEHKNHIVAKIWFKELHKKNQFTLLVDEILSTKERIIYYYIENNKKKMIQIDLKQAKLIVVLEYGKIEVVF